ncbi:MAG TPA: response regulator transcription factor [Candidatus Cybelea sp.]|jgi:DNA-binding response OmpR family regulator|nr:response regulator transcription factor [Candidatus Cybelea sp.]
MRVLILEDDPRIHQPLAEDLRREHHAVDVVEEGRTGLDFALTGVHDIVLLDILLPGLDGLEICRRLRAEKSSAYILMITSRDDVRDKVRALDWGADDYVVKPFDLAELSARIRAVSRRQRGAPEAVLERGRLRLDPSRRAVTCDGTPVPLTGTEYTILATLMYNPLQVFSRAMLREKISTFDEAERDSVKTHITNLRRKLRSAGGIEDPIENVYGIGYRLADLGQ